MYENFKEKYMKINRKFLDISDFICFRLNQEDNIKMINKVIRCKNVDWIQLATYDYRGK